MSYYGKLFKCEKHENMGDFFKAVGTPLLKAQVMLRTDSSMRLTKDGEIYLLELNGARNSKATFMDGGEHVDKIHDKLTLTSKFTVNGNIITEIQHGTDGRVVTIKREFNDDSVVETLTAQGWDDVAHRYLKA